MACCSQNHALCVILQTVLHDAFHAASPGHATCAVMLQILTMLDDNLAAAPDTLGDSRKETPEELAERHTRVQAGSLLALSSLIDLTTGGESGVSGGHAALGWRRAGRRLPSLINLTGCIVQSVSSCCSLCADNAEESLPKLRPSRQRPAMLLPGATFMQEVSSFFAVAAGACVVVCVLVMQRITLGSEKLQNKPGCWLLWSATESTCTARPICR